MVVSLVYFLCMPAFLLLLINYYSSKEIVFGILLYKFLLQGLFYLSFLSRVFTLVINLCLEKEISLNFMG